MAQLVNNMINHPLKLAALQARRAKKPITENELAGIMMWLALVHQTDVWAENMKSPDFPHVKIAVNRVKAATKDFNRLWELYLEQDQGFNHEQFWDLTAQLSDTVKAFTLDPKRMHSMGIKVIKETKNQD
jgi:hypothetical protein